VRRRLLLVTFAVTSLIVISFAVPLGVLGRRQASARVLERAESDARSVATALAVAASFSDAAIDNATASAVLGAFGFPLATGIHLPDGTVVGSGAADDPDVAAARRGSAFTARTPNGAAVLIPVEAAGGVTVVRVFVTSEELREGVTAAYLVLATLALLLISVALIGADRLGRSIVDPARSLREAAGALAAGELGTRVEPRGPPEIAEVGRAFNELGERLAELLQAEREAAADLSHTLRTPLAALRLQVETLASPTREQLLHDVARVEATVDRVITEARSRSSDAPRRGDLATVTRERGAFWSVLAEEQDRPFEALTPQRPVQVRASASELATVLDTLLENVFAHTPAGAAIRVTVDGPSVTVEDGGPGFDAAAADRGTTGRGSTGLGLDIIAQIAARAGGDLAVARSASLGGARVTVSFQNATEGPAGAPRMRGSRVHPITEA
jgi:signal transduction histidine kinase